MEYIYLDSHATTPVDSYVYTRMEPYFTQIWGNAGSSHRKGQHADGGVEWSRRVLANYLGSQPSEVIFTSSATEANNLALQGIVQTYAKQHTETPHVITSQIEHSAVREPLRQLAARNVIELTELRVTEEGVVSVADVENALTERTICVSIIYANNEIGTIQPITEIGQRIAEWRREHNTQYPLFHTDAVQAGFFLSCNVDALGVDVLSLSGHKLYGPKGVGALYVSNTVTLTPILYGGDQEFELRPGTPNVPAIVGMGAAVERLSYDEHSQEVSYIQDLQSYTMRSLKHSSVPLIWNGKRSNTIPNNIHCSIPGIFAGDLMVYLDIHGIAISTGSACHSGAWTPSHVMQALTSDEDRIQSAIRIGLLRSTTKAEIDRFIAYLEEFATPKTDTQN